MILQVLPPVIQQCTLLPIIGVMENTNTQIIKKKMEVLCGNQNSPMEDLAWAQIKTAKVISDGDIAIAAFPFIHILQMKPPMLHPTLMIWLQLLLLMNGVIHTTMETFILSVQGVRLLLILIMEAVKRMDQNGSVRDLVLLTNLVIPALTVEKDLIHLTTKTEATPEVRS